MDNPKRHRHLKAANRSRLEQDDLSAYPAMADALNQLQCHLCNEHRTANLKNEGAFVRQKYLVGEMMLMMVEKGRRYDMPVPPELERLERETNSMPVQTNGS